MHMINRRNEMRPTEAGIMKCNRQYLPFRMDLTQKSEDPGGSMKYNRSADMTHKRLEEVLHPTLLFTSGYMCV